jgi:hypothetical protein
MKLMIAAAMALLVGCSNDETQAPQCGAGQELTDLDGEKVCVDQVSDVFETWSTIHLRNATSATSCQNTAGSHCSGTHGMGVDCGCFGVGYSATHCNNGGTFSCNSTYNCKFKCGN